MTDPTPAEALKAEARPYPDLLSEEEQKALLTRAEELWEDLQANNLGGFSGINRPFWIAAEFKRVIEDFGRRDVGWRWSQDELDANLPRPPAADAGEARTEEWALVPRQPTAAMVAAAANERIGPPRNDEFLGPVAATVAWHAMLAAAIRKLGS